MSRLRFLVVSLGLAIALTGCGGGEAGVDLTSGDPASGKRLFAQQGCANCHTLAAAGSIRNVGPNLDEVTRRYPPEFILESITDPSAYIEKGSGGTIGGSDQYRIAMPPSGPNAPNAENVISEQELADLVAFITSSGGG